MGATVGGEEGPGLAGELRSWGELRSRLRPKKAGLDYLIKEADFPPRASEGWSKALVGFVIRPGFGDGEGGLGEEWGELRPDVPTPGSATSGNYAPSPPWKCGCDFRPVPREDPQG